MMQTYSLDRRAAESSFHNSATTTTSGALDSPLHANAPPMLDVCIARELYEERTRLSGTYAHAQRRRPAPGILLNGGIL